jgi:glycerate dehydrogenase
MNPGENQQLLSQGVFLDLGSVDNGDLDTRALDRTLPGWQWFKFTHPSETIERIRSAEVVVTNKCVLDENVLAQASKLKLVAVAATGTNIIDLEAAKKYGIMVCNVRDYASRSVAQHVMTMVMNLVSYQPMYAERVRRGEWSSGDQFSLHDQTIRELADLQMGIVGYGVLGKAVANLAKAMGMNVLIAEHPGRNPRPSRLSFKQVLKAADVISLHCPLNEETRGLFDRKMIQSMKPDAILINAARGGVVVESDLADALKAGELAGAGIDTLTQEPPPADHPLLAADIPNLIVTPHNAWASKKSRQACLDQICRIVSGFNRGQYLNRVV